MRLFNSLSVTRTSRERPAGREGDLCRIFYISSTFAVKYRWDTCVRALRELCFQLFSVCRYIHFTSVTRSHPEVCSCSVAVDLCSSYEAILHGRVKERRWRTRLWWRMEGRKVLTQRKQFTNTQKHTLINDTVQNQMTLIHTLWERLLRWHSHRPPERKLLYYRPVKTSYENCSGRRSIPIHCWSESTESNLLKYSFITHLSFNPYSN